MHTRLRLTLTSLANIYLILSFNIIQIVNADKPSVLKVEDDSQPSADSHTQEAAASQVRPIYKKIEKQEQSEKPASKSIKKDQTDKSEFLRRQLDTFRRIYDEPDFYFDGFDNTADNSYGFSDEDDFSPSKPINEVDNAFRRQDNFERFPHRRPELASGSRRQQQGYSENIRVANYNKPPRQPVQEPFRLRQHDTYLERPQNGGYRRVERPPNGDQQRIIRPQQSLGGANFDYVNAVPGYGYGYNQQVNQFNNRPTQESSSGGFLSGLFGLFSPQKPPKKGNQITIPSEPSYEFIANDLDTDKVSLGDQGLFVPEPGDYDDFNLDYQEGDSENKIPDYDFKDVLYSIRNNESGIITFKKFLSAASSLSDRAGSDPGSIIFKTPLTILSILGVFYGASAIGVVLYKYALLATGSNNGAALSLLPVALIILVPALLVTIYLLIRGAIDGQINLDQLARGDFRNTFRQDFDPIDFVYDAAVGSTAVLGLVWVVSVVV